MFTWLETTSVATTVASSIAITASLSAIHLIGYTLATGGALAANLRLLGVLFRGRPAIEVVGPATRAIALGLTISLVTGVLLFSARASDASANGAFRLKMVLLIAAGVFHFTVSRGSAARASVSAQRARGAGAIGLALWLGLAVAACVFILLE